MLFAHRIPRTVACTLAAASLGSMLAFAPVQAWAADAARAKHETVHATTSAGGSVNNISVTTMLESGGSTSVADTSNLFRLETTDEKVWSSNDGGLVWHSDDGRNITYTGQSNTALPVQIKITYTLDGNEVSPQEIAGKSGHVTIRYDYADAAEADGKTSTYTPFAAVTTVPLDASVFGNVQVTNGKVVREGNTLYAFGGGVTGSLDSMDEDQAAKLPTYFQIDADVSSFNLGSATTVISSNLFAALNGELTSLDSISDKVTKKIEDYAKQIDEVRKEVDVAYTAAGVLTDRLKDLTQLADKLDAASNELSKNNSAIDTIKAQSDSISAMTNDVAISAAAFHDFIGSVDGLTDEQRQVLYDKWNELDMSGVISQVSAEANSLKNSCSELNFSATAEAAKNVKSANFNQFVLDGKGLTDKLKEILEKDFGNADSKDKETLVGAGVELKEHLLDDLNDSLALPEQTTRALSASGLVIDAQVPAAQPAEGGKVSSGTVSKINRLIDDVFDTLTKEAAAQEASSRTAFTNYGGITDGTAGSVQFVFETSAI